MESCRIKSLLFAFLVLVFSMLALLAQSFSCVAYQPIVSPNLHFCPLILLLPPNQSLKNKKT
ncbi:hypothetical protein V6Z12_A11G179200 [Gossypium hirsutum]